MVEEKKYCSFDDLPLSLNVDDLMAVLQIGRNTAYELIRSNQIFSIRVGKQLRVPKEAVIDFLRIKKAKDAEITKGVFINVRMVNG